MELLTLKLVMLQGPIKGQTLQFVPTLIPTVKIGRIVRGNTVSIKDNGVSSKHLAIQFIKDSSKWVITDLNTSNGTIVNDANIKPFDEVELSDGDTVKIGEYTSIEVRLVLGDDVVKDEVNGDGEESRVRRNPPRRGRAAAKVKAKIDDIDKHSEIEMQETKKDNELVLKAGRPMRGRKAKKDAEDDSKTVEGVLEKADGIVKNRPAGSNRRREVIALEKGDGDVEENLGKPTRGRKVKGDNEENLKNLGLAEQDDDQVVEAIRLVGKKRGRKLKRYNEGDMENVVGLLEKANDEVVEGTGRGRRGGLRSHGKVLMEKESEVGKRLDQDIEKVEVKKGRGRGRRAKFVDRCDEVAVGMAVEVAAGIENLNSNSGVDCFFKDCVAGGTSVVQNVVEGNKIVVSGEAVIEKSYERPITLKKEKLSFAPVNNLELPQSCGEVISDMEGTNIDLGSDTGIELAVSDYGTNESYVELNKEADLEKMSLAEWLDYVEVQLAKQIYDTTEEMIRGMEDRARQFHKFLAQQQNEKGKPSIG